METLYIDDRHNYTEEMPVLHRRAVRALIVKNGKFAMQQAGEGYYKILGGGIDEGETYEQALAREVREEGGLIVIPQTVKEYGKIIEKRQDIFDSKKVYCCHTYVFMCDVEEHCVELTMTESEKKLGYHLAWASADEIIEANKRFMDKEWIARDTRIVELVKKMC